MSHTEFRTEQFGGTICYYQDTRLRSLIQKDNAVAHTPNLDALTVILSVSDFDIDPLSPTDIV